MSIEPGEEFAFALVFANRDAFGLYVMLGLKGTIRSDDLHAQEHLGSAVHMRHDPLHDVRRPAGRALHIRVTGRSGENGERWTLERRRGGGRQSGRSVKPCLLPTARG